MVRAGVEDSVEDSGLAATYVVGFRIAERVTISLVIVIVALVVSVAFWRSLQKVDFQLSREKLAGGGTVVLATPVFALLALIGFAWVSFSNPVSISFPGALAPRPAAGTAIDEGAPLAAGAGPVSFLGASGSAAGRLGDIDFRRNAARELVNSLNCLARSAGDVSAREIDALARLRLAIMEPVWDPAWGDFAAFRDWAEGRATAEPNAAARRVFEEAHRVC